MPFDTSQDFQFIRQNNQPQKIETAGLFPILQSKIIRCEKFMQRAIHASGLPLEVLAEQTQLSISTLKKAKNKSEPKNAFCIHTFVQIMNCLRCSVYVTWHGYQYSLAQYVRNLSALPIFDTLTAEKCKELDIIQARHACDDSEYIDFYGIKRSITENANLHLSSFISAVYVLHGVIEIDYYLLESDTEPQRYII